MYTGVMDALRQDLETLETAMRLFFQTIKRQHNWERTALQAGVDLDRPAAAILHILSHGSNSGMRLLDLANQLHIEAPAVTRKTQELEQAGYLVRQPHPDDKRAVNLRITPAGKSVSKKLTRAQQAIIAAVLQDWAARDRRRFVKLFMRFSEELTAQYQPTHLT